MSTDDIHPSPTTMPMFPLGSVLLPGDVLPLRIFEPRYRTMLDVVLDADRRFGQVLIERGSEVGGGDVRASIGCIAEIADLQMLDDGSAGLVCHGRERIVIADWLPDAPYPLASVSTWADEAPGSGDAERIAEAFASVDATCSRLGVPNHLTADSSAGDAGRALDDVGDDWTYQLARALQATPLDAHQVLAAPSRADRAEVVARLLSERADLLEWQRRG